jgi:DNA anti-recombination protein RmuC
MYSKDLRDRLGSVDRVREILFGPQLRTYERQFEQLEGELKLLQQDFQQELADLETAFEKELQAALGHLDGQVQNTQGQVRTSLEELRTAADRASLQLQEVLAKVDATLEQRTQEIDRNLLELRAGLQGSVRDLRQELFDALEQHFNTLASFKMNRKDMAELLFQVSMQARGEDLVPKLGAVGQEEEDTRAEELAKLLNF